MDSNYKQLPMIAFLGKVFFPNSKTSFELVREKDIAAFEEAMKTGKLIFMTAQKDAVIEDITEDKLYDIGVIGKISQLNKIMGGITRIFVECFGKYKVTKFNDEGKFYTVDVEQIFDNKYVKSESEQEQSDFECRAILKLLLETFGEYSRLSRIDAKFTFEILASTDIDYATYSIAEKISIDVSDKQRILEETDYIERAKLLIKILNIEINSLTIKAELYKEVRAKIDKTQQEYFLREELKLIHERLGDKDGIEGEIKEYQKRMEEFEQMPKNVRERLEKEIKRLKRISNASSESTVSRDYIELILDMPWGIYDKENDNIKNAWKILDKDHYGLKEVKERIVEFLAVRKLSDDINAPIICLVGPPGVGKTSIAKSVAKALNRKYVRMSLGGISDEAEIRGHRKTYIGAMPGRIVSSIKNAKTMNPLILFDEIDKIRNERKGDPAAALLEVLDGEQNFSFRDNYLEIPLDVSKVLFMCTANSVEDIPLALRDRLEIINIGSYTHEEKLNIALKYLVDKQIKANGLDKKQIKFTKDSISEIISSYTREAGVRTLERLIGKICRKSAKMLSMEEKNSVYIKKNNLEKFLGAKKFKEDMIDKTDKVGVVTGLAWTRVGGDTLSIETVVMKGGGDFKLTGNVGKVMEESAKTAVSYIRANSDKYGISDDFYKDNDIHIHIPEGAVPKDGPSAGITMTLSIISALTKKAVRHNVAMTGEITLTGRVLPIGGLKEKIIAAKMFGIEKLILPYDNKDDFNEVPDYAKDGLDVVFVKNMEDVVKEGIC